MKWLIILALLAAVAVYLAARYRRQVTMAWQVWSMFRQMKKVGSSGETKKPTKEKLNDVQLVRCEKCSKWISPENALKLRSSSYYCSSNCMEKAARLQSLVD